MGLLEDGIKKRMLDLGVSLASVCTWSGCTRSIISESLNGHRRITPADLLAIETVLRRLGELKRATQIMPLDMNDTTKIAELLRRMDKWEIGADEIATTMRQLWRIDD